LQFNRYKPMSKTSKPHTQRQLILVGVAIMAFLFGLWFHHNTKANTLQNETLLSATVLSQPRAITPFLLTNNKGNPFTLQSLKGHWNLVFFGFTNCPDLCPTTMAVLNQTYKKLTAMHQNPMPQVVFISVDPERDNAQRISGYLRSFNENFVGATGSVTQLDALTQEFSVLYAKVMNKEASQADDYSIDHSGAILLVNPRGQFFGVFSGPHEVDKIAHDLHLIMAAHN
jgi:protein SCO1/2